MCNSYRLSIESIWPAQIQDVNCAIRYLRANATDLGLDPDRIGVSGNSAGGHLSLMAAATNYDQIFEGEGGSNEVSSEIKAVCAIYPPTTIRQLEMLNLQTFFTAGPKEVRAWTVKKGVTAPEAAGEIHTDFEKGFIRAETISYKDFIEFKGEAGAKSAGKLRTEGVDYLVKDGDIMHFLFNV